MGNPLTQLAKLRRFKQGSNVDSYLSTEYRQNLKAIEDAFRKLGVSLTGVDGSLNTLNSSIPYSLYVNKTTNMPTVNTTEATITLWDDPIENIGDVGTFDKSNGIWTCNKDATLMFFGRYGVVSNSGEITVARLYLDGTCMAAASGPSVAKNGPLVSFGKRVLKDQQVYMTAQSIGSEAMDQNSGAPIFFNVVQSGSI